MKSCPIAIWSVHLGLAVLALAFAFAHVSTAGPSHSPTASLTIVDQKGRVVESGSPSATTQQFAVTVAPGGGLTFSPSTVNIVAGDSVQWTWSGNGHNVRAGTPCTANGSFCSPSDTNCTTNPLSNVGTVYTHVFNAPGTFSYYCSQHCGNGMTGTVVVAAPIAMVSSVMRNNTGFIVSGQTNPGRTVTIQAASNFVSSFANIGTATANGSGGFSFTDASATSLQSRFYRATYP